MRQLIVGLSLAATCFSLPADARVERIEILSRQAFAAGTEFGHAGSYEKLRGRAFFALDPDAAAFKKRFTGKHCCGRSKSRIVSSRR